MAMDNVHVHDIDSDFDMNDFFWLRYMFSRHVKQKLKVLAPPGTCN